MWPDHGCTAPQDRGIVIRPLERLREQHEQGLINSVEFLKHLLELAKEAAQAEQVVPEEEIDHGKVEG